MNKYGNRLFLSSGRISHLDVWVAAKCSIQESTITRGDCEYNPCEAAGCVSRIPMGARYHIFYFDGQSIPLVDVNVMQYGI